MTDAAPTESADVMSSPRLEAFRADVAELRIGGAKPAQWERAGAIVGLVAMVAGLVIAFVAFATAYGATTFEVIHRQQVLAVAGGALAVVGGIVWLRVSVTRHLRWWMIRLVHEQREQADRIAGR